MSIWQDFVEDINSWDNFFIIHDDESADRVCEFSKALGEFHIGHFLICSEDFRKHSLAGIDFLNIELKDKPLSNKVKRLFK